MGSEMCIRDRCIIPVNLLAAVDSRMLLAGVSVNIAAYCTGTLSWLVVETCSLTAPVVLGPTSA